MKFFYLIMKTDFFLLRRFFFSSLYPLRLQLLGLFFTTFCLAVNNSLVPFGLKKLLNSFLFISSGEIQELFSPILLYVLSSFFLVLSYRLHNFFWFNFSPALKLRVNNLCMHLIMSQFYKNFKELPPAKVANGIKEIVLSFPELIRSIFDGFLYGFLSLLIAVITVWKVSYNFGFGLAIWVIIYVAGSISILKSTKNLAKSGIQIRSKILSKTIEIFSNLRSIILFTNEIVERKKIKKILEESFIIDRDKEKLVMKETAFQGLSFLLYQCICITWLVDGLKQGYVSPGDFALILTINVQFSVHFQKISKELVKFADNIGIIQQGIESLNLEYYINVNYLPRFSKPITSGEIIFQNVSFQYKNSRPLFINAKICINAGEKIVIVGPSGSGKSTFINLLLRFHSLKSGIIFIDGQDINKIFHGNLRKSISIASQEPLLFLGTIMENIAYGNQKANKKEVINASKNAEIHDFITSLSEGYNTIIDPENLNFSVGQCQRIALARAFVKDSSILILDEALSHIEKTKVKRIENFLLKKTKKKTVIIITHHLSNKLAYSVNKILYFENGKIVERKKGLCCVNQNQE